MSAEPLHEARRGLMAIRLEVHPDVADDLNERCEAAFTALAAERDALDWKVRELTQQRLTPAEIALREERGAAVAAVARVEALIAEARWLRDAVPAGEINRALTGPPALAPRTPDQDATEGEHRG